MASGKSAKSAAKKSESEKSFSLISDDTFRRMYAAMVGCRKLEERGRRARTSRMQLPVAPKATRPLLGQEAVIVGSTIDLRADDTITVPSGEVVFREPLAAKKLSKAALAKQALEESRRSVIAFAKSSGAQLTIGTGVALAHKDSAQPGSNGRIVVSFGDADEESIGSWSEALHLAGKHQLPIIFVLRPSSNAAEVAAISAQAALSGVIAIPVDASDVVAIYRVTFESTERARKGTGATLMVCTQFVVDGETAPKADALDPIKRMEAYLTAKGLFSAKWKAQVLRQLK